MYIYVVYKQMDMTEGRGGKGMDKIFLNKQDAMDYIDDKPGVMGIKKKWSSLPHGDWEVREIWAYSSLQESTEEEQKKIRESALSKLTLAEKNALGLK